MISIWEVHGAPMHPDRTRCSELLGVGAHAGAARCVLRLRIVMRQAGLTTVIVLALTSAASAAPPAPAPAPAPLRAPRAPAPPAAHAPAPPRRPAPRSEAAAPHQAPHQASPARGSAESPHQAEPARSRTAALHGALPRMTEGEEMLANIRASAARVGGDPEGVTLHGRVSLGLLGVSPEAAAKMTATTAQFLVDNLGIMFTGARIEQPTTEMQRSFAEGWKILERIEPDAGVRDEVRRAFSVRNVPIAKWATRLARPEYRPRTGGALSRLHRPEEGGIGTASVLEHKRSTFSAVAMNETLDWYEAADPKPAMSEVVSRYRALYQAAAAKLAASTAGPLAGANLPPEPQGLDPMPRSMTELDRQFRRTNFGVWTTVDSRETSGFKTEKGRDFRRGQGVYVNHHDHAGSPDVARTLVHEIDHARRGFEYRRPGVNAPAAVVADNLLGEVLAPLAGIAAGVPGFDQGHITHYTSREADGSLPPRLQGLVETVFDEYSRSHPDYFPRAHRANAVKLVVDKLDRAMGLHPKLSGYALSGKRQEALEKLLLDAGNSDMLGAYAPHTAPDGGGVTDGSLLEYPAVDHVVGRPIATLAEASALLGRLNGAADRSALEAVGVTGATLQSASNSFVVARRPDGKFQLVTNNQHASSGRLGDLRVVLESGPSMLYSRLHTLAGKPFPEFIAGHAESFDLQIASRAARGEKVPDHVLPFGVDKGTLAPLTGGVTNAGVLPPAKPAVAVRARFGAAKLVGTRPDGSEVHALEVTVLSPEGRIHWKGTKYLLQAKAIVGTATIAELASQPPADLRPATP